MIDQRLKTVALVRFGRVPEVARCQVPDALHLQRNDNVVIRSHRGLEFGTVLETLRPQREPGVESPVPSFHVERLVTAEDTAQQQVYEQRVPTEFETWNQRIADWNLDLQLIEMEWTLDGEKLILYVLNERGPECTKLALQAAAAGLGIIEVQPVGAEGLVTLPSTGGGCGTCGCH